MRQAFYILIAVMAFTFMVTRNRGGSSEPRIDPKYASVKAHFDQSVKQGDTVLVDFWAPWCGPCRTMGPVVDSIKRDYPGKVSVYKVNVDEQPELARKYSVRGIPTFIVFKDGELVAQEIGVVDKSDLTRHF